MVKKIVLFAIFLNMQLAYSQTTTCPIANHWAGGEANMGAHFNKHGSDRPSWRDNPGGTAAGMRSYTDDARRALSSSNTVQINCPGGPRHGRFFGYNETTNVFAVSANDNRAQIVTAFTMRNIEQFRRTVKKNSAPECKKRNKNNDDDFDDAIYTFFSCNLQPEIFSNSNRCRK